MIPDDIYRDCLSQLGIVSMEQVAPGMSGARVYRCVDRHGDHFALKRWPRGVHLQRMDEVHWLMHQSRQRGCQLIPEVITLPHAVGTSASVLRDGYCWDLVRWMPGQPLPIGASLESIQRGASAICAFHESTITLGRPAQVAPAVTERLVRLGELDKLVGSFVEIQRAAIFPPALNVAVHRAASLLATKWNEVRRRICRSLTPYSSHPVLTHFVLRDIHREHLLFCDDQPTGLIDFDAIRIDTPAIDLARWVGSLWIDTTDGRQRDLQTVFKLALAEFLSESPSKGRFFGETEVALSRIFVYANPWISLANWLVWLTVDQRSFQAGPDAVAQRVLALIDATDQVEWVE